MHCFVQWGSAPHALLVFYLPFYKGRGPANSHLHTSLSSSTEWAQAPLHSYVEIYYAQKKISVMVSVQSFILTVKRKNKKKRILRRTEIFLWKRKKHRLLFSYWHWNVYRFFRKGDWGVKRPTIGPKKLEQLGTFMKVPNMNHCTADARRAFPVLLREPLGLEQAGRPEGVKCLGWLYSAVR